MDSNDLNIKTDRRNFLGTIATGAVAVGMGTLAAPLQTLANPHPQNDIATDDADAWFAQIKGKHRIVFDVTRPHGIFPFAWPRVFLMTNEMTGTKAKDTNVVVVLRHDAIPYAMEDRLWAKYNLGKTFNADDPKTETASVRNPFWKPQTGDFQVPGVGAISIGINELQEHGVMFCVCNVALSVYSAIVAASMNLNHEDVRADWVKGLLPGIKVVPSGVWALGRAQEHKCGYIFAG